MAAGSRAASRVRNSGQSLVEFAAAVPLLLLLFLGAFDVAVYISDSATAQAATRQSARLASILGGQQCAQVPLDRQTVDAAIAQDVVALSTNMDYSRPAAIYIYAPSKPDGVFDANVDVQYTKFIFVNGKAVEDPAHPSSFPLTDLGPNGRKQTLPNETSIGVELDWVYTPPTGVGTQSLQRKAWSVFKAMSC